MSLTVQVVKVGYKANKLMMILIMIIMIMKIIIMKV